MSHSDLWCYTIHNPYQSNLHTSPFSVPVHFESVPIFVSTNARVALQLKRVHVVAGVHCGVEPEYQPRHKRPRCWHRYRAHLHLFRVDAHSFHSSVTYRVLPNWFSRTGSLLPQHPDASAIAPRLRNAHLEFGIAGRIFCIRRGRKSDGGRTGTEDTVILQ